MGFRLPRRSKVPRRRRAFALALLGAALAPAGSVADDAVGLSAVRAQKFVDEDLANFDPTSSDFFGSALARGDFNGDGADDLATGAPGHDGPIADPSGNFGAVVVRYGVPDGGLASGIADTVIGEFVAGSPSPPVSGEKVGFALAACDFNHDGFDDLAVGAPGEADNAQPSSGAVLIFSGSVSGIVTTSPVYLTQNTTGVPSTSVAGDNFGRSLTCGDFDHDLFADLVVGAPDETVGTHAFAGFIAILPGSATGLLGDALGTALQQDVAGVPDTAESEDRFGSRLAVGDFNGDDFADLAVTSVGEDTYAGAVHVFFGGAGGLAALALTPRFLTETGIGGVSESFDNFGGGLATGDFDGDGRDDLAMGIPGQDLGAGGSIPDSGQVSVLYGTASANFDRAQFWTQDNLFNAGGSGSDERFGEGLAAGDFNGDGRDDLAAGSIGESLSGLPVAAGAVVVWSGSASGLSSVHARQFAPGLDDLPAASPEANNYFAWALVAGDFDGDGYADLVAGTPNEDAAAGADVGTETVLYGSLFSDGFGSGNTLFWSSHSP